MGFGVGALALRPYEAGALPLPVSPTSLPGQEQAAAKPWNLANLEDWVGGHDEVHLQRAIDALRNTGTTLAVNPDKTLKIGDTVRLRTGVHLLGAPAGLMQKANFGVSGYRVEVTAGEKSEKPAILVEQSCSIAGFSFFWPGQSDGSVPPREFGWAIASDGQPSSCDNIALERLALNNAYRGIDLDNGGQFTVADIYGQPISVGLRLDRIYDVAQVRNVHWWPFVHQQGQVAEFIRNNGVGFDIAKVDGVMMSNLFAYGYLKLMRLRDRGHGSAWAQLRQLCLDAGTQALDIEAASKLQIDQIQVMQRHAGVGVPAVLIRKSVREAAISMRQIGIDTASQGVVVEDGATGTFQFAQFQSRTGSSNPLNRLQQYCLAVEGSSAEVQADQLPYDQVSGPVRLGGVAPFKLDGDVTPANFGTPHRWASNPRVTPVAGGARFDLRGQIEVQGMPIPAEIGQEVGLFVMEATLRLDRAENLGPAQFYLRITDGAINDGVLPARSVNGYFGRATRLLIPFPIRSPSFRWEFVFGGAAGPCAMEVTNLRLWRTDVRKGDPRLVQWVYADAPNQLSLPANLEVVGGMKRIVANRPPSAGTHMRGDRVINSEPAAGRPSSWICTASGRPGTWLPEVAVR